MRLARLSKIALAVLFFGTVCATHACANPMRPDHIFEHQKTFTRNIAHLIAHIFDSGYSCTLGEVYRTHEQALLNARLGKGIVNSNHCYRLAVDLNLFDASGKYLQGVKDYEKFGIFWERLNPFNEWGGRFRNGKGQLIGDYNHFEMD